MKCLGVIDKLLTENGINYEFGAMSEVKYPYFVGSYNEIPSTTEDGLQELTFSLEGYTKGKWIELENIKSKIKSIFDEYTTVIDDVAVAICYENALILPTDIADMKRIEINLNVKEWSK
jgi:hypothetical protein